MATCSVATGYVNNDGGTSVTSGSFNVSAGDLIVVVGHADELAGAITWTISDNQTPDLVYTEIARRDDADGLQGGVIAWYHQVASDITGLTITLGVSGEQADSPAIKVYKVTGFDTGDILGALTEGNLTTDPQTTASITAETAGIGIAAWVDWNQTGTPTSSDLTATGFDTSGDISGGSGFKTLTGGAGNTANMNSGGTPSGNYIWFEIRTAAAAGPPLRGELEGAGEIADLENEPDGFVFWLIPADGVVEDMPARGVLEEETTDDTEVHGFTFWLTPENVEDFQPPALLDQGEIEFDDTLHDWFAWQMPDDVVDFQALPELHDTDFVTDDTDAAWLFWLTPEDVVDFQALPELIESDADFDDTPYQWTFWLTPQAVEDFQALPEFVEAEADFDDSLYQWTVSPIAADVVDFQALPELVESDADFDDTAFNWTFWLTPDDIEDFQPSPLLVESAADFDDTLYQWTAGPLATELVLDFQALPVLVESVAIYDDSLYQWVAWPLSVDVPVEDFLPLSILVEAVADFDDTLFNWTVGPNSLSGLPDFTLGLVLVTSTIKRALVTVGRKTTKVVTTYKGTRDGTTQ